MSIPKNKLKKLRKSLPKGALTAIAEKRKVTYEYVRRVLTGDAIRLDILQDAIEMAAEQKAKDKKLTKEISAI